MSSSQASVTEDGAFMFTEDLDGASQDGVAHHAFLDDGMSQSDAAAAVDAATWAASVPAGEAAGGAAGGAGGASADPAPLQSSLEALTFDEKLDFDEEDGGGVEGDAAVRSGALPG